VRVQGFDDLLPLAVWVRWHRRSVLEVQLPICERLGALYRHSFAAWRVSDAPMGAEDLPDGARRARAEAA
jgi:hypothetical protein